MKRQPRMGAFQALRALPEFRARQAWHRSGGDTHPKSRLPDETMFPATRKLRGRNGRRGSNAMWRQSEIIKELEARGIPLQESLTPPKIIDK